MYHPDWMVLIGKYPVTLAIPGVMSNILWRYHLSSREV